MKHVFNICVCLLLLVSTTLSNFVERASANSNANEEISINQLEEVAVQQNQGTVGNNSNRVIVFIPGILGTELFSNDAGYVWPPTLANALQLDYLHYDNILEEREILGWSTAEHKNLIYNYYGDFQEYFEGLGYIVEPFPYDWRDSNSTTARRLDTFINQKRNEYKVDRVDIVAHSMGGLVAKKFILDTKTSRKVNKLITLGTPFFGAPKTFAQLQKGLDQSKLFIKDETVRSIPAIYEMLPNQNYFNIYKTSYVGTNYYGQKTAWNYNQVKSHIQKNFTSRNYDNAEDFQTEMGDSVGKYVDFYRIIGDSKPTPGFNYYTTFTNNTRIGPVEDTMWMSVDMNGDGTVPVIGSAPGIDRTWYIDAKHADLASNDNVLDAVDDILQARRVSLRTYMQTSKGLKFTLYDSAKKKLNIQGLSAKMEFVDMEDSIDDWTRIKPSIDLIYPDGTHFVMENGRVISDPHDLDLNYIGSTLDFVVEPGNYSMRVSRPDDVNSLMGIMLTKIDGDLATRTVQYQGMEPESGQVIGYFSSDFSKNDVGVDSDKDGSIDEPPFITEVEPINHQVSVVYTGNETPQDPSDPGSPGGDPDDSNGRINIQLNGPESRNQWLTTDVSIDVSTDITIPIEEVEGGEGSEEGGGTDGEPAEPVDPTPEIYLSIDGGSESSYSGSFSYGEDGEHTVTVIVKDYEGNILGQSSKDFKIDKTKPDLQTFVAGVHGENGWLISDAEASVGSTDETSKLMHVDGRLDSEVLASYDQPFNVSEEGLHSLYTESQDNATNKETKLEPFKIDKTNPWISDVYLQDEYYWDQEFPIRFKVDDTVSKVASIRATINGRPVENGGTYRFTEPGWHTYRIEIKDFAGWKAVYEEKFEVYIPAKFNFDPDSLQLDHGSGMTTVHVELPEPFAADKISFSTAQLNGQVVHVQDPKYGYVKNPIVDDDENGIMEMMFKYERELLVNLIPPGEPTEEESTDNDEFTTSDAGIFLNNLSNNNDDNGENGSSEDRGNKGGGTPPVWGTTTLTMFGDWDQYHFKGYDTIRVSNLGYMPPPPDVTQPTISSDPFDNTNDFSVDSTPILTLSEAVLLNGEPLSDQAVQDLIQLKDDKGVSVLFTANWMMNSRTIQINPVQQWLGSHTYTVKLAEGILADEAGNGNAVFGMQFTTEPRVITWDAPLPLPVIEEEPESTPPAPGPSEQPIPDPQPTPVPTTTPPPNVEPIPTAVVENGVSEEDLKKAINQAESTGRITLQAKPTENQVALTMDQLSQLAGNVEPLAIQFADVTYQLEAKSLRSSELDVSKVSHIAMGAEKVTPEEAQNLLKSANNSDQYLVLGDVYHFSATAVMKDKSQQAIKIFNGKVKVTLPLSGQSKNTAEKGALFISRFNANTKQWDEVAGVYDAKLGTFTFETDKFSNWALMSKTPKTFADISGHWAQEAIELMVTDRYIEGVGGNKFVPDAKITRAEFVTMLVRVLNLHDEGSVSFQDIATNAWYASFVNRAYAAGLIKGISPTRFAPDQTITREEIAMMMVNALAYKGVKVEASEDILNRFADQTEISEWASISAAKLVQAGILHGQPYDNGVKFAPQVHATRAEAVTLLRNALDFLK